MTDSRRGAIAWALVIVPVWTLLVWCTHWEPVAHDGWGHWMWHRNIGLSLDTLIEFAKGTYVHNNPRLGQVLTMLVYTPGPWHSIVTPLVELALFYLLTLLVLGRRPCWRRADDALLFATIFAMAALTVPQFGLMLFYRPFTGNYLFGLVINLALIAPYRLHYERVRAWRWWWAPPMLVLGFAAGMCNEHTGPAVAGLVAVALFAFWRRGDRLAPWALAGLIGLVAGGIALYVAPGQDIRYNALNTQASPFGRILDRGLQGNVKILIVGAVYLLPLVLWVALGVAAKFRDRAPVQPRTRRVAELALGALSLAITLTLLLSPKHGPRLYLATEVLACAAIAGWVTAQLVTRWSRALAAGMAAIVIGYVIYHCVPTYYRLGQEFAARVAMLDAAPDHSVAEIPVYTVKRTRWSVGDDLLIENIRNHVSASFTLALIKMKTDQSVSTAVPDDP